jgi:hypothetical protein
MCAKFVAELIFRDRGAGARRLAGFLIALAIDLLVPGATHYTLLVLLLTSPIDLVVARRKRSRAAKRTKP